MNLGAPASCRRFRGYGNRLKAPQYWVLIPHCGGRCVAPLFLLVYKACFSIPRSFCSFFALFCLGYLLASGQMYLRNLLLVVAGYVFYSFWGHRFCALLFFTSVLDFTADNRHLDVEVQKRFTAVLAKELAPLLERFPEPTPTGRDVAAEGGPGGSKNNNRTQH